MGRVSMWLACGMAVTAGVGGAGAGAAAHQSANSATAAAGSAVAPAGAPSAVPLDDSVENFLDHSVYAGHIVAFTEVAPSATDQRDHLVFWVTDDGRYCTASVLPFDQGWSAGCSVPKPLADDGHVLLMTSSPMPTDGRVRSVDLGTTPMTWQSVGFVRGAATVTVTCDGQPVDVRESSLDESDGLSAFVFDSPTGVMDQHLTYEVTARDAEGDVIGPPLTGELGVS